MNLKELQDLAYRSSEYTRGQLRSIDTNLLIGSLFSLFIAFGLSVFLNILIYWIPSSFFLILIWTVYSIFARKKGTNLPENPLTQKQKNFQLLTLFKNFAPFFNSIAVIFAITFASLVIFAAGMIDTSIELPKIVPMISTASVFFALFASYKTINFLEREQFNISDFPNMLISLGCLRLFAVVFLSLGMAFMALVVFPIWSLVILHPIYTTNLNNIPFLLLVIILQMFTIAIFASYFSSISLKKELTNALTNLSILNNMISDYMISRNINEDNMNELKKLYYEAKRYEFAVDDTMRIVNFYFLLPNKVYFEKLE